MESNGNHRSSLGRAGCLLSLLCVTEPVGWPMTSHFALSVLLAPSFVVRGAHEYRCDARSPGRSVTGRRDVGCCLQAALPAFALCCCRSPNTSRSNGEPATSMRTLAPFGNA